MTVSSSTGRSKRSGTSAWAWTTSRLFSSVKTLTNPSRCRRGRATSWFPTIAGSLFAVTTPAIGVPTFLVFISLSAILLAGSFIRVGVQPILTEMQAPREESGAWNDQFEQGKVLIFAITQQRQLIRPIREILQAGGAYYYITDRRLEPPAGGPAVMHRARPDEHDDSVTGTREG